MPDVEKFRIEDFNPRSREGSDRRSHSTPHSRKISIHAPAKGATESFVPTVAMASFQSTLPRRERPPESSPLSLIFQFQSTLPRRERLSRFPNSNPFGSISIHAPAKGATMSGVPCWGAGFQFQSTLPRRERLKGTKIGPRLMLISIHAPAKGATHWLYWLGL